jgi:hypothetical protein
MGVRKNLLGQKYGSLTVLKFCEPVFESGANRTAYLVECDCGNVFKTQQRYLLRKTRKRCDECIAEHVKKMNRPFYK